MIVMLVSANTTNKKLCLEINIHIWWWRGFLMNLFHFWNHLWPFKQPLRSPSLNGTGAMLAMVGWLLGDASENLYLTAGPRDYITQHPCAAVGKSRELYVWKRPVPHIKLRQLSNHSPRHLETKTAHWALQETGNHIQTLQQNIYIYFFFNCIVFF